MSPVTSFEIYIDGLILSLYCSSAICTNNPTSGLLIPHSMSSALFEGGVIWSVHIVDCVDLQLIKSCCPHASGNVCAHWICWRFL